MSEQLSNTSDQHPSTAVPQERSLHWRDALRIPSAISAAGLACVLQGTRHSSTTKGVQQIAFGRTLDLIDGIAARSLQQESDAGALVDTVCDKLSMLVIAHASLRDKAMPPAIPISIVANNAASAALTVAAGVRHPEASYRPSKAGKIGMALSNIGIIGHLYAHALVAESDHNQQTSRPLRKLSTGLAIAGITLSALGNIDYARRAR